MDSSCDYCWYKKAAVEGDAAHMMMRMMAMVVDNLKEHNLMEVMVASIYQGVVVVVEQDLKCIHNLLMDTHIVN